MILLYIIRIVERISIRVLNIKDYSKIITGRASNSFFLRFLLGDISKAYFCDCVNFFLAVNVAIFWINMRFSLWTLASFSYCGYIGF